MIKATIDWLRSKAKDRRSDNPVGKPVDKPKTKEPDGWHRPSEMLPEPNTSCLVLATGAGRNEHNPKIYVEMDRTMVLGTHLGGNVWVLDEFAYIKNPKIAFWRERPPHISRSQHLFVRE